MSGKKTGPSKNSKNRTQILKGRKPNKPGFVKNPKTGKNDK